MTLKRVLISPIAAPTFDISTGIDRKTLSAVCCKLSSLSPVAPVFSMIVSYPSSISSHAAFADFIRTSKPSAASLATAPFRTVKPWEDCSAFLPESSISLPVSFAVVPAFLSASVKSFRAFSACSICPFVISTSL